MRGIHGRSWRSMAGHGELTGEEGEGGGGKGVQLGGMGWGRGLHGEGLLGAARPLLLRLASLLSDLLPVREKKKTTGRRREEREEEKKKWEFF
jgi:hypothetical protein